MSTDVPQKDQDLNHFHSFILRLQGGAINEMMSEAIREAAQKISDACADRGGKQKATVVLKLELTMDQKDKIMEVYPSIDEKHPKAPLGRSGMFYVGEGGKLLRENPRQLTLDDELEAQRERRRNGTDE